MRAESALQSSVMQLLARLHPDLVAWAIPNGAWFYGADPKRAKIIVHNMKRDGLLTPGAADICIAGQGRVALVEIKTPTARDLLGKTRHGGRLSDDQRAFAERCGACGVPYFVARSWEDVERAIATVWRDARAA